MVAYGGKVVYSLFGYSTMVASDGERLCINCLDTPPWLHLMGKVVH